jgi:phosphatidate cytidylyltransferase
VKRLLTAAVGVPLALAAIFRLPGWGFFLVAAVILTGAAYEFSRLARVAAPRSPWWLLPVLVPTVAALLARGLSGEVAVDGFHALALGALAAIGVGTAVLLSGAPSAESLVAMGGLAFAVPYFAVPIASLYRLQQHDPWVLFLLLAIVWLGDTAAYYVGSAWGSHKLAPTVSPNKSWEGALAGFAISMLSVAGRSGARGASLPSCWRSAPSRRWRASWATSSNRCSSAERASRTRAACCPATAACSTGWTRCCSPRR